MAVRRLAWAVFIALLVLAPPMARASELLTNGNFATGDLSGWTPSNVGSGTWGVYTGAPNDVPAPTVYGAITDQGSTSAGGHVLTQSFTVPADATSVTLSFQMFLWNTTGTAYQDYYSLSNYYQTYHQEAWIDIYQTGDGLQNAIVPDIILQTPNNQIGTQPSGFDSFSYDISALVTPGGTYTLRFAEVNASGAFYMGLQNVSIQAAVGDTGGGDTGGGGEVPEPATFLMIGSGFVALGLWRRRSKKQKV